MSKREALEEGRELADSLVGKTITRALWFDNAPGRDWTGHETAWLWLDDGRVIEFGAWGYDAWGATLAEIRVVDVETCLHCGQPHRDAPVCDGWELDSLDLPRGAFAWCDDGRHAALVLTP